MGISLMSDLYVIHGPVLRHANEKTNYVHTLFILEKGI